MYKYNMGGVHHPKTDIIAQNNEGHDYNPRQTHAVQINDKLMLYK